MSMLKFPSHLLNLKEKWSKIQASTNSLRCFNTNLKERERENLSRLKSGESPVLCKEK